jgi:acetyltransferase-like isoleucine patch superfamily enzyme
MPASDEGSLADRMYRRLMAVRPETLAVGEGDKGAASVRLRDVVYYGYEKGLWQLLRGWVFRSRLRSSGRRFFLGRGTQILFPSHLSVGSNVAIGDYTYMNCFGKTGVKLGDDVRIREFGSVLVTSQLSHPGEGLEIGDGTYVGPHCILGAGGGIRVGRNVTFGAYVQILAENHEFADFDRPVNEQGVVRQGIVIEDGCWLGNSVIVLDGVNIGRNAVVGAGSIVTQSLPEGVVAVGNPARVIRSRETK